MKANRGMFLETIINRTLEHYEARNVAYISKRHLPIKVYAFAGKRVQGWLDAKTQTDYYGVFKGKYLDFEAKQTNTDSFPLSNVRPHQLAHMRKVSSYGAIAFFVVYFQKHDEFYLMRLADFLKYVNDHPDRKSIPHGHFKSNAIRLELLFPGVLDLQDNLERIIAGEKTAEPVF